MKNTFVKIIFVLIILILLLGTGFYIFFESDYFKSDKELFYKYLGRKNLASLNKINTEPYEILSYDDKNYEFSGEVIFDSLKKSLQLTDEISLEVLSSLNVKKDKSMATYTVKYGDEELLSIDYLKNGEKYALKSDEITDKKYYIIENKNLKKIAGNLGITDVSGIPDKIEKMSLEDKNIDLEKLNKIKDKYVAIIDEKIPDYKYITEKNILINVSNEELETTKYSLKIREREIYDILYSILNTLKEDDETLQFYIDYTEDTSLTIKDLKTNIRNIIKQLESKKNNYSETDNVTFSVYEYKGKTVRTEILDINENGIKFTINTLNKNEKLEFEIISNKTSKNEVGYISTIKLINNAKKDNVQLDIIIDTVYNKNDIASLENTSSLFLDEDVYKDTNLNIVFSAEGKNDVDISCIGTENEEQVFSFNGELVKGKDVDIEDFTDENSILLNSMTEEELKSLVSKTTIRVITVISQKANVIFPNMLNVLGNTVNTGNDNETEITTEFVKSELNTALENSLDEYVAAATLSNEQIDSSEYINEEKIKSYCTKATEIIFTDDSIKYVAENGKTYEGEITTDINTRYLVVEEVVEK